MYQQPQTGLYFQSSLESFKSIRVVQRGEFVWDIAEIEIT